MKYMIEIEIQRLNCGGAGGALHSRSFGRTTSVSDGDKGFLHFDDTWTVQTEPRFWGLQNLEDLYLSSNQIESVGSWIFNITSARSIDLSNNTIKDLPSGSIPSGLFNSSNILFLDIRKNFFSDSPIDYSLFSVNGYIYKAITINTVVSSLSTKESLDLSNNHLSGEIPSQLVQLHYLSVFRVSYNNLSGIIPYKDQFCTFNKSSFEGNPDLSEELIEKNCWSMHGTSQTYNDSNNGDHEDTSKRRIAASFAIGFWGVIAVLAFNKNGRIKFFMAADDFLYACMDVILGLIKRIEKYLCQLQDLQFLDLSENSMKGNIDTCLKSLHSLENLDLSSNQLDDWVEGGDCCNWIAVRCDKLSYPYRVVSIDLTYARLGFSQDWYPNVSLFGQFMKLKELLLSVNGIAGWVNPQDIWHLQNVQLLNLDDNNLNDESIAQLIVPWIHNLTSFELRINGNNLKDIRWISNLTSLSSIDLSRNQIKDVSGFWGLQNLEQLDLSDNQIESVGSWIFNITSARSIDLSFNMIKDLPSDLCQLQDLQFLDLSENSMKGNIDTCLKSLYSLENLDLSSNQLDDNDRLEIETESPSWVPSFQLKFLFLSNCVLNKRSGRRVPSFLSTQNALTDIDLSHSSIIVSNLSELINNVTQTLNLRGNTFHGPFLRDNKNSSSSLEFLDLSDSFWGLQNLEDLSLSGNQIESVGSGIFNITSARHIDLSNNMIKDLPSDICQLQDLQSLYLYKNSMKGNIDTCLKRSIPISLFNSSNIMILDIRKNFFSGPVPTQVCHMQNLHIFDLSNNYLSGTIPNCLKNITSWNINSPVAFEVNTATYFRISFYTVVFSLTTKGRFYSYMGTPLSLMTDLDLSKNQFSGPIPFQMGYLSTLHSLNLSNNHLTGPIPNSFQNLENIESLDLSNNYLSGEIPSQLVKLHSLSVFSVAYNNLSGIIPYNDQFCTFNKSCFEGNPGLSGELLIEKKCWSMHGTSQTYHDNSDGDHEDTWKAIDNEVIFYSFIAASFAIGFWGVIAVLAFNKNGRIKFFMAADDFLYACMDVILGFIKCIEKCIYK
ncbi:hypothetical protein QJS10_CPB19g01263 [Acorus calamus]|uniref:Leucine-rich repeat-containing N-terminal plant-type domain-containing protein n=1 Tax=Acorus calamus TaxID=4465 RepID=A0AAV9CG54_ACOCL|nr:hypothetical protein QJS10_CPB19g01263 [Acorus calamus]